MGQKHLRGRKVGGVFTSSGTQHGSRGSTILGFHVNLFHHGMIVVGLPYTFKVRTILQRFHDRRIREK